MDRKIPEDVRRKIRKKKYIQIFCSAVLLAGVIGVLASVLGPSVSGDSIDVSTVVRGPLEISLGAVGSVVPFYEEIISSPISTKIVDVSGEEPRVYRGYVPPRSVVIPGTCPKRFPAGEYGVPCALIIGQRKESTDLKTSLNDALRDFDVPV